MENWSDISFAWVDPLILLSDESAWRNLIWFYEIRRILARSAYKKDLLVSKVTFVTEAWQNMLRKKRRIPILLGSLCRRIEWTLWTVEHSRVIREYSDPGMRSGTKNRYKNRNRTYILDQCQGVTPLPPQLNKYRLSARKF